jgi:sporulation protein YtfJ
VAEHPIQGLMQTAMENIKEMVDVNTIIGEPVETSDGQVIIPVSKVGFGFAAGGSEFSGQGQPDPSERMVTGPDKNGAKPAKESKSFPFGGGSGGGVSITPVAFIVVGETGIRLLNMEGQTHLYDRLIDFAPQLLEKLQGRKKKNKDDLCNQANKPTN